MMVRSCVCAVVTALIAVLLAGCAAPVVFRNPSTGEVVSCTTATAAGPPQNAAMVTGALAAGSVGTGGTVPTTGTVSDDASAYDLERQCARELEREGWTCVSGCR